MMRRKRSALSSISGYLQLSIGLLSLTLFTLVMIGLFAFRTSQTIGQPQQPEAQSPSPTSSPVVEQSVTSADWKMFTEPQLAYSLKYPPEWQLSISKSDGYPYIGLLDPIAQQTVLADSQISRGAMIEIYTAQWLGKDSSISSLQTAMRASSGDSVLGGEPNESFQVHGSSLGEIVGARSILVEPDLHIDTFAFLTTHHGETLLYRVVLTIFNASSISSEQVSSYTTIFQNVLNSLEVNTSN